MKIITFLGLIVISAAMLDHADDVHDSVAKYCTTLVASAIFLLAFWLPSKINSKK